MKESVDKLIDAAVAAGGKLAEIAPGAFELLCREEAYSSAVAAVFWAVAAAVFLECARRTYLYSKSCREDRRLDDERVWSMVGAVALVFAAVVSCAIAWQFVGGVLYPEVSAAHTILEAFKQSP